MSNGEYKYDTEYGEHTLQEWVHIIHRDKCYKKGLRYQVLRPGPTYDSLAMSIGKCFDKEKLSVKDQRLVDIENSLKIYSKSK